MEILEVLIILLNIQQIIKKIEKERILKI